MARPKTSSMLIASEWISNAATSDAWDTLRDLVDEQPERAWRMVQLMVGYAPDYSALAAIAAGPLEDLMRHHGDEFMQRIHEEALTNVRMRTCLRAVYTELPPELSTIVENEDADVRVVEQTGLADVSTDDIGLMVSWMNNASTSVTSSLLTEMTRHEPEQAWDVIRVLVRFADEDVAVRDDVFSDAVMPFVRTNFAGFQEKLAELARESSALAEALRDATRPPIEDADAWRSFLAKLPSV